MKNFGFVKVASAIPNVKIADTKFNSEHIFSLITKAVSQKVNIVLFPELSLSAYTCADLFFQSSLTEASLDSLLLLVSKTANLNIISIVGLPFVYNDRLYNVAAVFSKGRILGFVPKAFIPNYNEFYEKRWFSSGLEIPSNSFVDIAGQKVPFGTNILFGSDNCNFAVEVCEDVWLPQSPSYSHALNGAQIIFNLSASNEVVGKDAYRHQLVSMQSAKCLAAYIYAGAGFGESSTDLIFSGTALLYENGSLLAQSLRFSLEEQLIVADVDIQRLQVDRLRNSAFYNTNSCSSSQNYVKVSCPVLPDSEDSSIIRTENPLPFVPAKNLEDRCDEIFNMQVWGLATRLQRTGIKKAVVGISGGLDSTLALLVIVRTFDKLNLSRKDIIGLTMPGFGTTNRTHNNSIALMESLGITSREISIKKACEQHFKDIDYDPSKLGVTFENTQARERTQILMDVANREGGLVVGTGDLSELALGWATYNADQMSMYGVNAGVPKTLVRSLVRWAAVAKFDEVSRKILLDVIDTPVSPELLPADENGNIAQKTEDLVGPYELHDFFLYHMLRFGFSPSKIFFMASRSFEGRFSKEIILKWMKVFYKRFFQQQFKRSCMPDGPKVGSINLSPRGDWRMPSDASSSLWLDELNSL